MCGVCDPMVTSLTLVIFFLIISLSYLDKCTLVLIVIGVLYSIFYSFDFLFLSFFISLKFYLFSI
jgi:hypothetical protein